MIVINKGVIIVKDYGVFDILGPVMVGPSSSHTAGAAKLGKIASEIAESGFYKVEFFLHGSFASTYKGHGTDKALVAGILGYSPADEELRDSFSLAKEKGIEFEFIETEIEYAHPNTAKIVFKYMDRQDFYITGSSIGGGSIIVTDIDGDEVEFTGEYPTIILKYADQKGIISKISSILANKDINIATMKVTRDGNNNATMFCEIDSPIGDDTIDEISSLKEISRTKFIL